MHALAQALEYENHKSGVSESDGSDSEQDQENFQILQYIQTILSKGRKIEWNMMYNCPEIT